MKIGIYIAPSHAVPPGEENILAPWEMVAQLVDGLASRNNHRVYLFAPTTSHTKGILKDFGIEPTIIYQNRMNPEEFQNKIITDEKTMFINMIKTALEDGIGILHVHQVKRMYPLIVLAPKSLKFVFTIHDPITEEKFEQIKLLNDLGNCYFVSMSNAQRGNLPIPFVDTVYNGVSVDRFTFSNSQCERFISVGRIVPEKGFEDAIVAVRALNKQLLIVGQVYEEIEEAYQYWEKEIKPQIDGVNIKLQGVVKLNEMVKFYQDSRALLFPIKWEEPFGLVMIEAMACGTPVVAYGRGSVPEVVVDGVTGFVVEPEIGSLSDLSYLSNLRIKKKGIDGLVEAVKRINAMSRQEYGKMRLACRKHVEEKFTVERMVAGYERVYRKVLGTRD